MTSRHILSLTTEELASRWREGRRNGRWNWTLLQELHRRGRDEEFSLARRWLQSHDRFDRITGIYILSRLGANVNRLPYAEQVTSLLLPQLELAENIVELHSCLQALAWQDTKRSRKVLLRYVGDKRIRLRSVVARGLHGQNRAETDALLKLAQDPVEDIADWAVFNLIDPRGEWYEELHTGLIGLASHPNRTIAAQAIAALASRHAPDTESLLLEAWQTGGDDDYMRYLREAAEYLNVLLPEEQYR